MTKFSVCTVLVILICVSSPAFSQAPLYDPAARPMFVTLPPPDAPAQPAAQQLTQWIFSWKSSYNGVNYNTVIVGRDPSINNTTTTIPVAIIPIKMVYGPYNGNFTFDPNAIYSGNMTTTQMVAGSLLFQSLVDYNQGGTDLGTTQYQDAYQRGNFWGYGVKTNTNFHFLLKGIVAPELTLGVPPSKGNVIPNPWSGIPTGQADLGWFDAELHDFIAKGSCTARKPPCIAPNVLPLFITEDVYLTQNGCCVGGYHSSYGPAPASQTYSYSTIIQQASVPVFSQDIDALSHEIGEWAMDPFATNSSPCPNNGLLEIGDPLGGGPDFGDFPYTVNGFTYHPQDLAFITWFGAPAATSLDQWNGQTVDVISLQNENLAVCQTAQ